MHQFLCYFLSKIKTPCNSRMACCDDNTVVEGGGWDNCFERLFHRTSNRWTDHKHGLLVIRRCAFKDGKLSKRTDSDLINFGTFNETFWTFVVLRQISFEMRHLKRAARLSKLTPPLQWRHSAASASRKTTAFPTSTISYFNFELKSIYWLKQNFIIRTHQKHRPALTHCQKRP